MQQTWFSGIENARSYHELAAGSSIEAKALSVFIKIISFFLKKRMSPSLHEDEA